MFFLAKLAQAAGVVAVSYALYVGVTDEHGMARELRLLAIGMVIFYVGRFLESRASSGS